jgi:hypothetical protein
MASETKVTLGQHELTTYPQRHAYLANRLGKFFDRFSEIANQDVEAREAFFRLIQGHAYDLLCVFIPQLAKRMPRYEFEGFGSQQALDAGDYDEDQDTSPTFPEIVAAFEQALELNRLDLFKHVLGWVDPKLLRATLNAKVAEQVSRTSQSSPSASTGSAPSTSSGTTGPTPADDTSD